MVSADPRSGERKLHKLAFIFLILFIIAGGGTRIYAVKSEKRYLVDIKKYSDSKKRKAAEDCAAEFFKAYPGSALEPEVRLMLADLETSPPEAIKKYRLVSDTFPRFSKNDYARFRICEIYFILSDWKELKQESIIGEKEFTGSKYRRNFLLFRVLSETELGDYDAAETDCARLIALNHDYNHLAAALLIMARIQKKKTGFSKQYLVSLRRIVSGFEGSDVIPTAIYLLGEFYENKKMYDEAWSAYSDLVSKYPGSPEAEKAGARIGPLAQYGPRSTYYLPGRKIIESTASIDIHPEIDPPQAGGSPAFYSLSVGPFAAFREADRIKKLLKEFGFIKTVRLKNGYAVYVGQCPDEDSILKIKIRLAEEYGINARIVRISIDEKNSYIYGD
jgi:tetratricopeptide (TPR) repeat protein